MLTPSSSIIHAFLGFFLCLSGSGEKKNNCRRCFSFCVKRLYGRLWGAKSNSKVCSPRLVSEAYVVVALVLREER